MNDVGHAPLPGDVLLHQYLQPNNITMYRLAKAMNLPQITVSGIIRGKRRITTSLAYHLAYVLGTSPEYWLELIDLARHRSGFKRIVEQRAVDRGHPVVIVAEGDERRRCPAGHAQFVAERRNEPLGWCSAQQVPP